MSVSAEFQKRFKNLVSDKEFRTFKELAQSIGITYVTFSKAYNYAIVPKPQILIKFADFFDTSVEYLACRTADKYFSRIGIPTNFEKRIEELRLSKGYTYYELGMATDIGGNYFIDWKNKKYIPSLDYLKKITDHFEVSLDYLLGRTDDRTSYDS